MATTIALAPVTGSTATLGVTTDLVGAWKYQWKRNGVFLPHGNDKSYVTPTLKPDDWKAKYSVVVYGQDKTEESPEVMLVAPTAPKPATPPAAPAPAPAAPAPAPAEHPTGHGSSLTITPEVKH